MKKLTQNSVKNSISNEEIDQFSLGIIVNDIKKQGLKAGKWFFIITILFGLVNILFFIIAFLLYIGSGIHSLLYLICTLILGIGLTAFAFTNTYKFILIDTLSIVYKYLTPFFKKLSILIIDKITSKTIDYSSDKKIQNSINVDNILLDIYGKKVPSLLQKAILFLIKRIPFAEFIFNMKSELEEKKTDKLSVILFDQIDQYIKQSLFLSNNMKWIAWLLPLNIVLQIIFIYLIK